MDTDTAWLLNQVTGAFYRQQAESFEQTRRNAWPGWERVVRETGLDACPTPDAALRVLDVACGSFRFERFLADRLPHASFECWTVDANAQLAQLGAQPPSRMGLRFQQLDVIEALLAGTFKEELESPPVQVAVCFGFFHHVPGEANRQMLMRMLLESLAPEGYLALSLWRFMESPSLAAQAHEAHDIALSRLQSEHGLDPAQLELHDYLLGWQKAQGTARYCHHFTEEEADRLVQAAEHAGASLVARYHADGRTGALNTYLVFKVAGRAKGTYV